MSVSKSEILMTIKDSTRDESNLMNTVGLWIDEKFETKIFKFSPVHSWRVFWEHNFWKCAVEGSKKDASSELLNLIEYLFCKVEEPIPINFKWNDRLQRIEPVLAHNPQQNFRQNINFFSRMISKLFHKEKEIPTTFLTNCKTGFISLQTKINGDAQEKVWKKHTKDRDFVLFDVLKTLICIYMLQKELDYSHGDSHLGNVFEKEISLKPSFSEFSVFQFGVNRVNCVIIPNLGYQIYFIDYEFASNKYMKLESFGVKMDTSFHLSKIGIINSFFEPWEDVIRYFSCALWSMTSLEFAGNTSFKASLYQVLREWSSIHCFCWKYKPEVVKSLNGESIVEINDFKGSDEKKRIQISISEFTTKSVSWFENIPLKESENYKKNCPIRSVGIAKSTDHVFNHFKKYFETDLRMMDYTSIFYNIIGLLFHHVQVSEFHKYVNSTSLVFKDDSTRDFHYSKLRKFFDLLTQRPNLKNSITLIQDLFVFQKLALENCDLLITEWQFHEDAPKDDLLRWEIKLAEIWNETIQSCFLLYCEQFQFYQNYYKCFRIIDIDFVMNLIQTRWKVLNPVEYKTFLKKMFHHQGNVNFIVNDTLLRVYNRKIPMQDLAFNPKEIEKSIENSNNYFDLCNDLYLKLGFEEKLISNE